MPTLILAQWAFLEILVVAVHKTGRKETYNVLFEGLQGLLGTTKQRGVWLVSWRDNRKRVGAHAVWPNQTVWFNPGLNSGLNQLAS